MNASLAYTYLNIVHYSSSECRHYQIECTCPLSDIISILFVDSCSRKGELASSYQLLGWSSLFHCPHDNAEVAAIRLHSAWCWNYWPQHSLGPCSEPECKNVGFGTISVPPQPWQFGRPISYLSKCLYARALHPTYESVDADLETHRGIDQN